MPPRVPFVAAATFALAVSVGGCAARPHMCGGPGECEADAACVAGRCQRTNAVAAVQAARRLVIAPVAAAYVRPHEPASLLGAEEGALPPTFTLGREADGDARLYLRFALPLPDKTEVVEAYLLLERSDAEELDVASPITLRLGRVRGAWDPRSIDYARQPSIATERLADAEVSPRPFVRIDVREVVRRWRRHDPEDQGLVVFADGRSATGVTFALAPSSDLGTTEPTRPLFAAEPLRPVGADDLSRPRGAHRGPVLELYVQVAADSSAPPPVAAPPSPKGTKPPGK